VRRSNDEVTENHAVVLERSRRVHSACPAHVAADGKTPA
jgi:hypothetical protein